MSFASEITKQTAEKEYLCRMEAGFQPTLSNPEANVWSMTNFPDYKIKDVVVSGVTATLVTTRPNADLEWWIDSSGTFEIYLNSFSPTTRVIINYYLFFSTTYTQYIELDPIAGGDVVEWLPRIQNSPNTSINIENIAEGVFSISNTNVVLNNIDNFFQTHLSIDHSFNSRDCKIWMKINDAYRIIFSGIISSFRIDRNSVSFSVKDSFNKLNKPALMGNSILDCYHSLESNGLLNPANDGQPIPLLMATSSEAGYKNTGSTIGLKTHDIDTMRKAVCINYSETLATNTNRDWSIMRVLTNSPTSSSFSFNATDYTLDNTDPNCTIINQVNPVGSVPLQLGDWVIINGTEFARVLRRIYVPTNKVYLSKISSTLPFSTARRNLKIIVVNAGVEYFIDQGYYSMTHTVLSGGDYHLKITFNDNFEAAYGIPSPLDPQNMQVCFQVDYRGDHARWVNILKTMLDKAGVPLNLSSFPTGTENFSKFSIPFLSESGYSNYLNYVQAILSSNFYALSLDDNFEVNLVDLAIPSSGSTTTTETEIDDNSISIELEYDDLCFEIISKNEHRFGSSFSFLEAGTLTAYTFRNYTALYLHNTNKSKEISDVMETGPSSRLIEFFSARRVKYIFQTLGQDLNAEIGDNKKIVHGILLGNLPDTIVKLVSISTNDFKSSLIGLDLQKNN